MTCHTAVLVTIVIIKIAGLINLTVRVSLWFTEKVSEKAES